MMMMMMLTPNAKHRADRGETKRRGEEGRGEGGRGEARRTELCAEWLMSNGLQRSGGREVEGKVVGQVGRYLR